MSTPAPIATAGSELRLDPAAEALVFLGADHPIERIAVPELALREGEALVAVELATVCASDRHTVQGRRRSPVPSVLGHEQVGRVVALGPGEPAAAIDGMPLSVGDRVVWGVAVACGECRTCRRGIPNKCERLSKYGHEQNRRGWELSGGIATHVHLLARTPVVRVPDGLPAELLAPSSCATATAAASLAAAEELRTLGAETVLVSGSGMLGLNAIAMAAEAGARVVAVDPDPSRRALAMDFGADAASEPGAEPIRAALATVGSPAGFGVAIEASGAGGAIAALIETADVGATIVLAGSVFTAPPVSVSAETIVRRLLTIRGVHNYRPEHLVRGVEFLRRADQRAFAALVGEVLPFAEAERALTTTPTRGARIGVRP